MNTAEAVQMALAFKRTKVSRIQLELVWNFRYNVSGNVAYNAIIGVGYAPNNNVAPASITTVLDNQYSLMSVSDDVRDTLSFKPMTLNGVYGLQPVS